MSEIKIKDEPLDAGYGDIIPAHKIKTEKIKNNDVGLNPDEKNKCALQNNMKFVDNELENLSKNAKIKNEPEDLPDDFFDCLDGDNFIDEIVSENDSSTDTSLSNILSEENRNRSIDKSNLNDQLLKNISLREKYEKLKKENEDLRRVEKSMQENKRLKERSGSSSDNNGSDTSLSRVRKKIKIEKEENVRCELKARKHDKHSTRYKDKERRRRELSKFKTGRRSRSQSQDSANDSSDYKYNKVSHSSEHRRLSKSRTQTRLSRSLSSSDSDGSVDYRSNKDRSFKKSSVLLRQKVKNEFNRSNENEGFKVSSQTKELDIEDNTSMDIELPESYREKDFPIPFVSKKEPMDNEEGASVSTSTSPNKKLLKVKEENKDEPQSENERILNVCGEAIKHLHFYENKKPFTKFIYTPTIIQQDDIAEDKYRSPLHKINNVKFKFNSISSTIDLKPYGLIKLPEITAKIAYIIGFDAFSIMKKLNHEKYPYGLKRLKKTDEEEDKSPSDSIYKPFYASVGTQTEIESCTTCILRQLRKYQDVGVQIEPYTRDFCIQADPREMMSMAVPNQFYNSHVNQQPIPTVMYNYGHQMHTQHPNQYVQPPYGYYPGQGQAPSGGGYEQSPPINNINPMTPVNFPQQQQQSQQQYPLLPAHPGPRNQSTPAAVRRNNIIIPTNSTPQKRL